MSIPTQMDALDELCSRVGNIHLESSVASITSVDKLEDESISVKEQNGSQTVEDFPSVQYARHQDVSSAEGSPIVSLPVYITQSTFPGKEGELLLIPARRMSNYNEKIQDLKENNSDRNSVVEDDPEYHDCLNTAKVNQSSSSNCISTSELNASDIDKLDDNIVQNILNSSFTELAESDSDEEQTNINREAEIRKLSSKTVFNSTFTESDLKGTEEPSVLVLEKERIRGDDSSSQLTNVSDVSASVEESCSVVSVTKMTVEAELDCTAGGTDRKQVIQTDTLLQESNVLSCETLTVVESGDLQCENSTLIVKSNSVRMTTKSEGKGSLLHAVPLMKKELKASVTECSPHKRNVVLQEISEKLTIHGMNNLQEIAEETIDCETVLKNSIGGEVTEALVDEVNVPLITPDVETVLNTSFIESPVPEEMENILNTSFIEDEGTEEKDDAEIITSQEAVSEICELQKSLNDVINAAAINNVEEGVQAAHNETFTEESQNLTSENRELEKSLNEKVIEAVGLSESDKNCVVGKSVHDACQDTVSEEFTVAVKNLEGKDSQVENSAGKVLRTSFAECTSVVGAQVITMENSSQVKRKSCGSLRESIGRDLIVPNDNETEKATFETETVISATDNGNSKADVEGSTSFTECNITSFDLDTGNGAGIINTSRSPRNIVQDETPFETSLNQTYIENTNMETEENASFTGALGQAQNVSFTESTSVKGDEMLTVDSETIKSQDTVLRELPSESLTIHNEVEENTAGKTSTKTVLDITFTEELTENVIESEVNIPMDISVPNMNTTTDAVEPQMITTSDIMESEMNTSRNVVESEMNTTIDIVESKMNTTIDTVESKMNTVKDIVEWEMNTTIETVESEINSMDVVESEMNTTIDIVESKMNTTIDIVESKMNTTIDIVESKMNTIDVGEPHMNVTLEIEESKMNTTTNIVELEMHTTKHKEPESELNSTFCVTEPVLDSTSTGLTLSNKIEKPSPDASEHMISHNCEMNIASQVNVASTDLSARQEVDVENVKTASESTMERIVEERSITSDCLVHENNELSKETSITKIELNSTFVTYNEHALNISDTGTEQNVTFKEYFASKETVEEQMISPEVFVHENCELQSEKSALKIDLNSTFVTSSELPLKVSDSETKQNASSDAKKNVENMISSEVSDDDELTNDTNIARTNLNSTFVHDKLTKETSSNVKDNEAEITQSVELSENEVINNLIVNNGSFKETIVHEKQKNHDESFVNQCRKSVLTEGKNLNAGVLEDTVEVVVKKTIHNSMIEKTEASLANNLEVSKNTVTPVSSKKDNISTNLNEFKSDSVSASKELCSSTPAGIVDVNKSSHLVSCEPFNQDLASNRTLNPCAPVEVHSQPIPVKNGEEKKHELIEFDEVLSNFSINLDNKDGDLNKIEKSFNDFLCVSEKISVPDVKNEEKIQESEFTSIQMSRKNVRTSTPVHQTKDLIAKGESKDALSEKNQTSGNSKNLQGQNTTGMKTPQENRHKNVSSNDINVEIQKNLDGIFPEVPPQKPMSEEPSTAAVDLLDSATNDFLTAVGNEQFQDANFVFGDEVFKDPSTFDFLTQFGNSTTLCDLRKESLYIKFDPLVGSPRSVAANDKPSPTLNIVREEERDENKKLNITDGANDEKSEKSNETCAKDSEGSVESFFRPKRPLLASKDLQDDSTLHKLKEYKEECSSLKAQVAELQEIIKTKDEVRDDSTLHKLKESQDECISLKVQIAELKEIIKTKDAVHKNEVAKFESQIVALDFDYAKRKEEVAILKRDLDAIRVEKVAFDAIMNEYERALSQLVNEKEQNCAEFRNKEIKLTKELQEWQEKCAEMERALSDAVQKLENLQSNAKKRTEKDKELLVKMKSYEKAVEIEKQKYATLKEHAAEQLESANEKLLAEEKRHILECTKYSSSIANLELQVTNLQNLLEQKTKENETLMTMCHELVDKFEH